MRKLPFVRLASVAAVAVMLAACGGGGDESLESPTAQTPETGGGGSASPGSDPTTAKDETLPAAVANAGGFLGQNSQVPQASTANDPNPSKSGTTTSASINRDTRSNRNEGFRPGIDAEGNTPVDEKLLAKKSEREQAKALGDPLTNGRTVPVAPTPTGVAANANTQGHWSSVYQWPLIPIHLGLMPDGRMMSFGTNEGGRQTGKTIYAIFDPSRGLFDGHTIIPKDTMADIFCSAQFWQPVTNQFITVGGDNLVNGFTNNLGNNASTIFTPSTNTMVAGRNMALPRWYATTVTMPNGTTYIQGGLGGEAYGEVRDNAGNFRSLTGAPTQNLDYWYPRLFWHPSNRVFGWDSYGNYFWVTPGTSGTGTRQIVNQWDVNAFGEAGSTAVFAPGRVLNLSAFTNRASIIDYRTNTPTFTATAPMAQRRQNVSATTLPNGQVLATGGSAVYNEIGANAGVDNTAAIWNPSTGTWSIGASGAIPRLYHSVAMLMPDGSVLVGGGGAWGPLSNNNVEFYYPPYLFQANGQLAPKPTITDAPLEMNIGSTIRLTVDDANAPITRVTMLKMGAVTHSINMDQSFNELTFTRSGNVITAQLPTEIAWATPGYYMIFGLTASGTPSQARVARMNIPDAAAAAPTGLTGTAGTNGNVLNWTNGTGAARNIIERGTSATGPWTPIADVTARTTYTDNQTADGSYFYQVKSVNSSGNPSAASNVATVTRGGGTTNPPEPVLVVPSAPQGVAATFTQGQGVNVAWTNHAATTTMPAATQNTISRGTAAAGPFTLLATIPAGAAYLDNVTTAGTYYYQVITRNSVGPGPAAVSNAVTVTTTPTGTVAAAPTGLSGYTCGAGCWSTDTGVRFNWTPSATAGVTGHQVERANAAAGPWTQVGGTLAANAAVYIDKNVTSGTTYYYRVRAIIGTTPGNLATLTYGVTSNITLGGGTAPATPDANITVSTTTPTVGTAFTMSGSTSTAGTGATIAGYQWTITAGANLATISGANTATVTVNPTGAGTLTLSLLVTNNQGQTNTETRTVTIAAAPTAQSFSIESQGETRYLVMNWWRGDPALEGDFRDPDGPGACTGPQTTGGNCFLGARKTFRPIGFNIGSASMGEPAAVQGVILMDVPQYENGAKTYDHYRLPVEIIREAGTCSFSVRHVRTKTNLEFNRNPPGLEILPHKFNMNTALCNAYPANGVITQAWLNQLNTQLTTYLGARPAYAPIPYPYRDPRTTTM